MTSNSMRLWLVLFCLVVFIGGAASGVLVNTWLIRSTGPPRIERPGMGRGFRSSERPAGALLGRMSDELDLTDDQRQQLEAVFETQRESLRGFYREVRERFEAEQGDIRAEVEKILTPDQQERFHELTRRRRMRGGSRTNRFGPPSGNRF